MEHRPSIENWVLAKNFKLNVYRLADPQDTGDHPQTISFVILAPGQGFDPNHPIIKDMGFSQQKSERGNYVVKLGHDPDDTALRAFVNRLLAMGYDDVVATPFVRDAAFILNQPDLRLRVISEQQWADMPAGTHIVTDRPFIVVINPDAPGTSTGAVIPELSEEEAKRIDPLSFPYQGGMFLHAQYVQRSEWFVEPSQYQILVVNDQVLDHQIHTAVHKGWHVYYGGILYGPIAAEEAEAAAHEGYIQSYLDDQGRPNAAELIDKMRMVSGYVPRTAQGWDLNDYSIEQQRIEDNLHVNERVRTEKGATLSSGAFVRSKLLHYGFGRDLQTFFAAVSGGEDTFQGSFHEDNFATGAVSELQQEDHAVRTRHEEARQAEGKTQDAFAFPAPQAIDLPDDPESSQVLKWQVLGMMERLRREEMADRASTILDPVMLKTLRHLIESDRLGTGDALASALETKAILASLNRSDLLHTLRRVQNDIVYLHPGDDEALNIDKVVRQAFRNTAQDDSDYHPAILDYALSLRSQEQSLSAVDSIARRMLQSPIPSQQVTAQNYFMERLQIFRDAQGLPASETADLRLQALFHAYFSQESPERRGLPTETFLFKKLHSRAYRDTGNFADVLEQFAARHGEEIVNIQQRIADEVARGLRNPVDGEPIREAIGDAAFFDYHGVGLETYETRTRTDGSVREQNAYAGRYLYVDNYEFMQQIIQMDKDRQARNRAVSPEERVHNLIFANIPEFNWGEGGVNQAKVFVREEGLQLVPTDLIRRQRGLQEKYLRNRDRDYDGIADHVFVKKGGTRVTGKILRGYSRAVISQTTPTARYDNNETNAAGYAGKGTFVETRYLWMLEDHMLHDMRVAERRQRGRQQPARQEQLDLAGVGQQAVFVRAMHNIFDNHADKLDAGAAATQYLLNPDFAHGFIAAMRLAEEQNVGNPGERLDILNFFSDSQMPRKLAILQGKLPESFLALYGDSVDTLAQEMAKPAFLHFVHGHVLRSGHDPLPDYPLPPARNNEAEAPPSLNWQDITDASAVLLRDLHQLNASMPEDSQLPAEVIVAYEQAVSRWFDENSTSILNPADPFLAHFNQNAFALLTVLRRLDEADRTEDGIYRLLLKGPDSDLEPVSYRESMNLRNARETYLRTQAAVEKLDAEEGEHVEIMAQLNRSRDDYAIALLNEQQRIHNAYVAPANREEILQSYQEALQEIRADVSSDAEIVMDRLQLMVQEEPAPQTDYRAFARHHGLQEGFYRRRDGTTIEGYYFDVHDRDFRAAIHEPTHPHHERYRHKVFAHVWGEAVDRAENNNRTFVRRESLEVVPPGIVRENGRLLETTQERRALQQQTGTQANPDVAREVLLVGEPGREVPGEIYDHYGIAPSVYLTRKGASIYGRYLEIHDPAFKQAINQLGTAENRIYGSHVFTEIPPEAFPEGKTPPAGTVFVRETALDKIPVALIREHARLQQLRLAVDYDEFQHLPRYTHTSPGGKTFAGYWIPNFSLEEVRRVLPGTVTELVSGQMDDTQGRDEFVRKHRVWPMPLVHQDALPFLPDAMTVDNAMTREFANSLVLTAKGNANRIQLVVDAYNSVTHQENQKIHESLEDLVNYSRAEYEYQKYQKRKEKRDAEREARALAAEEAVTSLETGPDYLSILTSMQGKVSLEDTALQSRAIISKDAAWDEDLPAAENEEPGSGQAVIELYRGEAEAVIREYGYSDDPGLNAIASAYEMARQEWQAEGEELREFEAYFDRADAEERIVKAYESGTLVNHAQLKQWIQGDIQPMMAQADRDSDPFAHEAQPAVPLSSPMTNQELLHHLIRQGEVDNKPEAALMRDLLGMNIENDVRRWIEDEIAHQPDEAARWIFLRAVTGQIHHHFGDYRLFHDGIHSQDPTEISRVLIELRAQMSASDNAQRHAAYAITPASRLRAQDVLLLADLAKQRIDQRRETLPTENRWELDRLNLFRGWHQVREVAEGNVDALAKALLDNAHLAQVFTREDAMNQAYALIKQARLATPVLPEQRNLLWDALRLAGIETPTVADLNSIQAEFLPRNAQGHSGDAYFADPLSALIAKGKGQPYFMVPHESFAIEIPQNHYDLMVSRLPAKPTAAQPVKDATSGVEFADRCAAQLNQLQQLSPGGIAVIIAGHDFANPHAPALQQKLPALNLLARNFEVLSVVNQPFSHLPGFGQMIFLQKTTSSTYAQADEKDYFGAAQRMMADIVHKADKLHQAFMNAETLDMTTLTQLLATELRHHYQANVAASTEEEAAGVSATPVVAATLDDVRMVVAHDTIHQVALLPGSYGQDCNGQLFVVLSAYQEDGVHVYTVSDVDGKMPQSVQEQYFALRDALLDSQADPERIAAARYNLLQSLASGSLHDANAQFVLEGLHADLHFYRTCALVAAQQPDHKESPTLDQRMLSSVPMEGISADALALATGKTADEMLKNEMVYALPPVTTFSGERIYSLGWLSANLPEHAAYTLLQPASAGNALIEDAVHKLAIRQVNSTIPLGRRDIEPHHLRQFLAANLHKGEGPHLEIGLDVRYPKNTLSWQVSGGNAMKNPVLAQLNPAQQQNAMAHILNGTQYTAPSVGVLSTAEQLAEVNTEIARLQRKLQAFLSGKGVDRGTEGPRESIRQLLTDRSPGELISLGGITDKKQTLLLGISAWVNNRKADDKPLLIIAGDDSASYSTLLQQQYPGLVIYTLLADSQTRTQRIQQQILAARQADIVIMPAAQLKYSNEASHEGRFSLLGNRHFHDLEIAPLVKDEKSLASLPGDAKTGLAKHYIGNYLQAVNGLRQEYEHLMERAPQSMAIAFSHIIVTAPELYKAPDSTAFASVQVLVGNSPGAKLSVLTSAEHRFAPDLNYAVLATNIPRVLDKAKIVQGDDLLATQLLYQSRMTLPAHTVFDVQPGHHDLHKAKSSAAFAKATAQLAISESRVTAILAHCQASLPAQEKAIAIVFDKNYLSGKKDIREKISALAAEKGLPAVWATSENNEDIRRKIGRGSIAVVFLDSETTAEPVNFSGQIDRVILSALPSLERMPAVVDMLTQLDPQCSSQEWVIARNSIETSKYRLLQMGWGKEYMTWPSDQQLFSSPYASALWEGEQTGANALYYQQALPQLEKLQQQAQITSTALHTMQENLIQPSPSASTAVNANWYVDMAGQQVMVKPVLANTSAPTLTELTWHTFPVAAQAVDKVLSEEVRQHLSVSKAVETSLAFKGETLFYHPRMGEENYLYAKSAEGKYFPLDAAMFRESAVSALTRICEDDILAVSTARKAHLQDQIQHIQDQMDNLFSTAGQYRELLAESHTILVEKGYCQMEPETQRQANKQRKLSVLWEFPQDMQTPSPASEQVTHKGASSYALGNGGS